MLLDVWVLSLQLFSSLIIITVNKLICYIYLLDNMLAPYFIAESGRVSSRGHSGSRGPAQTELYGDAGDGVVKVPKIFWEFCTKGVLTMEWIEGIKLTDQKSILAAGLDIQHLVDQVLSLFT